MTRPDLVRRSHAGANIDRFGRYRAQWKRLNLLSAAVRWCRDHRNPYRDPRRADELEAEYAAVVQQVRRIQEAARG